jgi:hypothetical protein
MRGVCSLSPEADILSHHQVPPRTYAAVGLLRARSLRDEELDRPAIMSELFPTKLRCLGIGPCYNLTFGGTAPLVIQWLGDIGHSSTFRLARLSRPPPRSPCRRQRGWCSGEPGDGPATRERNVRFGSLPDILAA